MNQNLKIEDLEIDLFDENSCVVSISLLDPIGIIKKVSNNFYEVSFIIKFK
jgi:hypothetical protein